MVQRILLSLSVGLEKYQIIEAYDSVIVQQLRPSEMDLPEEWITLHSAVRSHHGLKACLQFLGLLMLSKQQNSKELWECQN